MAAATPPEHSVAEAGAALKQETALGASLLRRHGWRLLLVFAGLLLPMWGFAELAARIHARDVLGFDTQLLLGAQAIASTALDRSFVLVSALGYGYGVIPVGIVLVVALALKRHVHESAFAFFALGGSLLLNTLTKQLFARDRPSLWEPITAHASYSFPSGHAMASASLACVLIALAWGTRWRWPVLALAGAFAFVVGLSRVYLGVHYPSDILAGWAAATAWTLAAYLVVFRGGVRPWRTIAPAP